LGKIIKLRFIFEDFRCVAVYVTIDVLKPSIRKILKVMNVFG